MLKLKPEIKHKWLQALRSGNYDQGRSRLRNDHGEYCCLGVLCDLVGPNDWGAGEYSTYHNTWKDSVTEIPFPEWSSFFWLGCDAFEHELRGIQADLMDLNDNKCKTFSEIADYIENKL